MKMNKAVTAVVLSLVVLFAPGAASAEPPQWYGSQDWKEWRLRQKQMLRLQRERNRAIREQARHARRLRFKQEYNERRRKLLNGLQQGRD